MPKNLNVSDHWKEMARTKTWVDIFEETVRQFPEKEALVFKESNQRFTYNEYKEKVDEIARGLYALGASKGTHVGIWMTNIPEWVFVRLAIYKLGAVMIPFHTRYRVEEMRYVLGQSDTEILVMEQKFLGKIDALGILYKLVPELREKAKENEIRSNDFSALKHVVVIDKVDPTNMYSLDEAIQIGSEVSDDEIYTKVLPQNTVHIVYTSGTTGFPKGVETPNSCKVAQLVIYAELCDLKPESQISQFNAILW